jgi:hypothetical protein
MKERTIFSCELCGFESEDRAAVAACESIPMKNLEIEVGDIVTTRGGGYGWWNGSEAWFHRYTEEEQAEAVKLYGHHAGIGKPKFVVVDLKPKFEVSRNSHGEWGHEFVPILFSPDHANRGDTRIAFGWTSGQFDVRGKANPRELALYQKKAEAEGIPEYFSY